uniref:exodeoxyribonuclease III n=1 Tax=Astyanax mexicanus TaxID=7994 RepID=A0A3B1J3I7_ASTMX
MTGSNSHITILTLNVNGLNAPIKRHRLANWIKSQDPSVCCIQETHLTCRDTHRLKIKGWRKIYQANGKQKKAGVAILFLKPGIETAMDLFKGKDELNHRLTKEILKSKLGGLTDTCLCTSCTQVTMRLSHFAWGETKFMTLAEKQTNSLISV